MDENISYGDRIFKLLQKLERHIYTPDLHSFTAQIKNGTVFVEARQGEVFMRHGIGDSWSTWAGTYLAAANRLEMLGIDLNTVEI